MTPRCSSPERHDPGAVTAQSVARVHTTPIDPWMIPSSSQDRQASDESVDRINQRLQDHPSAPTTCEAARLASCRGPLSCSLPEVVSAPRSTPRFLGTPGRVPLERRPGSPLAVLAAADHRELAGRTMSGLCKNLSWAEGKRRRNVLGARVGPAVRDNPQWGLSRIQGFRPSSSVQLTQVELRHPTRDYQSHPW